MFTIEYRQFGYVLLVSFFIWLFGFINLALLFLMLGFVVFEDDDMELQTEYGEDDNDIDLWEMPWHDCNWLEYYNYTLYYSKFSNVKASRNVKGIEYNVIFSKAKPVK